jgi:hypothetical protein
LSAFKTALEGTLPFVSKAASQVVSCFAGKAEDLWAVCATHAEDEVVTRESFLNVIPSVLEVCD